jgi:hypothetical protein
MHPAFYGALAGPGMLGGQLCYSICAKACCYGGVGLGLGIDQERIADSQWG